MNRTKTGLVMEYHYSDGDVSAYEMYTDQDVNYLLEEAFKRSNRDEDESNIPVEPRSYLVNIVIRREDAEEYAERL